MSVLNTIIFAFLLGILPACLWLWFWLRHDKERPEPPKLILKTFFYGSLSAIFAFFFQILSNFFLGVQNTSDLIGYPIFFALGVLCVWAFFEEIVKYFAAWHGGLKTPASDEKIDPPIYLISAALGFAALENTLFLIKPLLDGSLITIITTAKVRFIGSTLVHVASSGLLGMFIGYSLFFMKSVRKRYFLVGLILATVLHALFNLFIIKGDQNSFIGFLIIWLFIILLILSFEYIKRIKVIKIQDVRQKEKENIN
jgi:RsiW-degrading membrane proteinase PrsW (M82 family)